MVTLHDYWRSSASYRLRIAMGLAGMEWEAVTVDLQAGAQTSEAHMSRNPQGLVPVLEIDGHSFTQSLSILEYLDETRDLGLLPKDPAGRQAVRALSYAIAMEIHPVCNLRVAKHAVAASGGAITMQGWMQTFIGPGLAAFETMLDGGDFCYGDGVTMADICLVPQLYNARRWEVDLAPLPKIRHISDRLDEIPAFAAAHPDLAPH
ncbi:MAG: maleylacetoacetate isomerase [Maritimibacter sp.]|uniref:maleylacetoacetate isomerase n=1 Tax=Maritimibacter sp. TaxID=2003363 RepID=UPI001D7B1C3C|nr:maleylacetoacetate isomerase [Maritimibacter sp.]MBL6429129.1 maleylacetoacetate isomerase [Maritimibacter sp.]